MYIYIYILYTIYDAFNVICSTNKDGWASLHYAATNRDVHSVNFCLDRGADLDVRAKVNDLHVVIIHMYVCMYVCVHIFIIPECLLRALFSASYFSVEYQDGSTPLHIASDSGHIDVARLLLEKGANIEAKETVSVSIIYIYTMYHKYIVLLNALFSFLLYLFRMVRAELLPF